MPARCLGAAIIFNIFMYIRVPRTLLSLTVIALLAPSLWADDTALEAAKREYALHFFSVDAHVDLAKQQYEHGNRLQAFYTLETARRYHFPQEEFIKSFRRIFLGDTFDNSPKSEAALRAKVKASPNDFEALTRLADIYISREEWDKAIPLLESARKLRPDDFSPAGAMAEVYQRMGKQQESKELISSWTKDHPDSIDTYHARIDEMFKNNTDARSLVDEALKKYPDDAALHFDLGIVLERAGNFIEEQKEFEKAVQLGPKNEHIQGWVARFYLKREIDKRRALDLYLNVYFLDPDFYDSEYAESRIQKLAPQVAEELLMKVSGKDMRELAPLLPAAESVILRSAEEKWTATSAATVIKIMGSEDEANRGMAMTLLAEHRDANVEKEVAQMLDDPDLRKRGMAGYLAVKWQKEKALPVMKKWLEDPAELARFDAISALIESGGPAGRKIVEEYAGSGKEPCPQIRRTMAGALKQKADDKRQ